jgi:hypothetical protein
LSRISEENQKEYGIDIRLAISVPAVFLEPVTQYNIGSKAYRKEIQYGEAECDRFS